METKPTRPMTPFDEWTVPNELHTLKLLLPYTPAASQPALGMLIKVIELQHTMEYFQTRKQDVQGQDFSKGFSSPMEMLGEIAPYLPPEQANMIDTFRNMMNIMEMVQMMQTFTDSDGTASAADPDDSNAAASAAHSGQNGEKDDFGMSGSSGGGFDPMNLVMGMLSPKQQEMFEMYQTMFSDPPVSDGQDGSTPDSFTFESQEENFSQNDSENEPIKERTDIHYE